MIVTTDAIVINSIKYGENSLIVKCYTKKEGVKSYMLKGILSSKKGKLKPAYFQPLSQLQLVANHNKKSNLNSIREVSIKHQYKTIYANIYKQSIALFLSEILNNALLEEEANNNLYIFIESSLIWFDTHNIIANFHLLFLINLTKYLGFSPQLDNVNSNYFDMSEGRFLEFLPKVNYIFGNDLIKFKQLLGINFDTVESIKLNSKERQRQLLILIQYFELHLSGFRKPKSLEILTSIFH